ncbi:MAG: hypothetical protein ABI972_28820 [Acidobacteriota bacterium]
MTPALAPPAPLRQRSGAVTLIGVIFLSLGLMWLFGALFQGAFFTFLNSMRPGGIGMTDMVNDPNVPVTVRFLVHYAKIFWIANIAAAAVMSICSLALLRRKNWGRLCFIFFALLGLLYSLVALGASALLVPFFQSQVAAVDTLGAGTALSTVATIAVALIVVKCVLLAVFFGWTLRKLTRPHICAEFS